MKRYRNISDSWGDAVPATLEDYADQAKTNWECATQDERDAEPDMAPENIRIEARDDGIYINGDIVAEVAQ